MKKINKKGFTLVELLAVIVVLALLMVVAGSSIGNSLENAKNKLMVVYAEKVLNAAYTNYQTETMLYGEETRYYSIETLMNDSDYYGGVKIEPDGSSLKYSIALFNAKDKNSIKLIDLNSTAIDGNSKDIINTESFDPDKNRYSTNNTVPHSAFSKAEDNLIDFSKVPEDNLYVAKGDCNLVSSDNSDWKHSDFINVTENMQYEFYAEFTETESAGIAWYNASKTCIKNTGQNGKELRNNNGILQAPENAKYIRVSWVIKDKSGNTHNENWKNTVKLIKISN